MSSQTFYHKPFTPEIPLELWAAIIQQATYPTDGYEPDPISLRLGIRYKSAEKVRYKQWRASLVSFVQLLSRGHC